MKIKTTLTLVILIFLFSFNVQSLHLEPQNSKTALILNPSEYLYGKTHCIKISNILIRHGYNIEYKSDEEVDLNFTKYNLSADIIYINTHGGYWDTDDDRILDTIVIATGEKWTNNTMEKYKSDVENNTIVRGKSGDNIFVSITPKFIEKYYTPDGLNGSFVFMATCHSTYDDSMAKVFLNANASVYMGWTGNTICWTNSITSVWVFRLLCLGFKVKNICRIIGYGGILNFLLNCRLTYFGDENYRI